MNLGSDVEDTFKLCGNISSPRTFISYYNMITLRTVSEQGWNTGHGFIASYTMGLLQKNFFSLKIHTKFSEHLSCSNKANCDVET